MKELDIGKNTTLTFIDEDNSVEIYTCRDDGPDSEEYVPFDVLEERLNRDA